MAKTNIEKRRRIRALEAKRDKYIQQKQTATVVLQTVRSEIKALRRQK